MAFAARFREPEKTLPEPFIRTEPRGGEVGHREVVETASASGLSSYQKQFAASDAQVNRTTSAPSFEAIT